MGKIYEIERREGTIKAQVVREYKVVNGKVISPGYLHVLEGMDGEEYYIPPNVSKKGYKLTDEILKEIEEAMQ